MRDFMREAVPGADAPTRALAGGLIATTFSEVGRRFSEEARTPDEIHAYAEAMADMLCAYVDRLARASPAPHEDCPIP